MKRVDLSKPEFFFIAFTRALLGAGIGLLAAGKFRARTKRFVGAALVAVGALTTIPAVLLVLRSERTPGRVTAGA